MTAGRMVGLLIGLAGIGIAMVCMRAQQSHHLYRIQELQFRHCELRRRIWDQEMELARLRSPQMIRERYARLRLGDDPKRAEAASPSPR